MFSVQSSGPFRAGEAADSCRELHRENKDKRRDTESSWSPWTTREEQEWLDAEEADYRRVWEIGNKLFYKGRYLEAAARYTEAMKKNPTEPAVFGNRAQCHIFLGALPQGLEDAEKCIELDPTYLMGYVCKAKVQALMQNYESAMETYIEGLKCDPTNYVVLDGFKRCMTCIQRSKGGHDGFDDLNDILRDWHSDIALCTELKKNMEELAIFKKEASDERLRWIESERVSKHDHLLKERDTALQEVEKLRQRMSMAIPCKFCAGSAMSSSPSSSSLVRVESNIPSHFICAISQEIMKEPHFTADGFTYEGDSIRQWLEHNNTSPMTNLELRHRELIPNLGLRSAIQEWLQQHYTPLP